MVRNLPPIPGSNRFFDSLLRDTNKMLKSSKLVRLATGIAVVLTSLVIGTAQALPLIGSPSGLSSPQNVITFDELGNLQNQAITNQFQAYGATFQNSWWDNANLGQAGSTGFSGGDLVSGPVAGQVGGGGITINFSNAVTDAAVATVDGGGLFDISSFLGNVLVETFQVAISLNPGSGFMGFTGSLFDELRILPSNQTSSLSIDTLQFNSSVPAPATVALLVLGLVGIGFKRKRVKAA